MRNSMAWLASTLWLTFTLAACKDDGVSGGEEAILAIEGATVLPMTAAGAEALVDTTVVVRNGRISWLGPAGEAPALPRDARRIDGRGKWLMPALADAHVHVENDRAMRLLNRDPDLPDGSVSTADVLIPYLANGVLQVGNLAAMTESLLQRAQVESEQVQGPHMMLAAMVDGDPPLWPEGFTRVAGNAEQARQVVRDIEAEGFDQVKTYANLTLEAFTALVDEARAQGLKVLGHLPRREMAPTEAFFQAGFGMVAHAEEFFFQSPGGTEADIPRYVDMARRNGTWLTATLTVDERILEQTRDPQTLRTREVTSFVHPTARPFWYENNPYVLDNTPERLAELERLVAFNRKLVAAFVQAGIPVLAGTDSLVPGVAPGFALHDELEALAGAGMSPRQVLQAATRLPAEWMGVAADRGTLAVGKRADLLLLDADPLASVSATRAIAAVIAGGRPYPRAELDRMMRDLAARYRLAGSAGKTPPR
jgi:imidazolonepropionase-like amidohydrolase